MSKANNWRPWAIPAGLAHLVEVTKNRNRTVAYLGDVFGAKLTFRRDFVGNTKKLFDGLLLTNPSSKYDELKSYGEKCRFFL